MLTDSGIMTAVQKLGMIADSGLLVLSPPDPIERAYRQRAYEIIGKT